MAIKVKVNWSGKTNIPGRLDRGLNFAANQALINMEPFVPKRENHLRDSGHVTGHEVVYKTPYARPQFYGIIAGKYRIHNYTTPGTGKRWDLRMKGNQALMKSVVQAFVKGAGLNGSH
jgi:hypothetical protein